jgi:hypothetical protein
MVLFTLQYVAKCIGACKKNIVYCPYFNWLFTHYVVMSDFYLKLFKIFKTRFKLKMVKG